VRDPDEVRMPLTERARRAEAERDETEKRNIILKARLDDINRALPEWSERPILTRIGWMQERHAEVRKAIEAQYRELKAKYDAEKARADRLEAALRRIVESVSEPHPHGGCSWCGALVGHASWCPCRLAADALAPRGGEDVTI